MADHIQDLIDKKRNDRTKMLTARDKAKPGERKKWDRWIDKNDDEIEALKSAQEQIIRAAAVKVSAKRALRP